MPGFFVSNKRVDIVLQNRFPERCIKEEIISSTFTAKRNTLNKFLNDKTFTETKDFLIIIDGIILNKSELYERYNVTDVANLMVCMYRELGESFFDTLRGGFTGALYDKAEDKWLVFTNHAGDIPVYYSCANNTFFAGTQVNYVIDACHKNGVDLSFDETAAYQMLTYGFMIDDATYAHEIRRLRGGTYLVHHDGISEVKVYHKYTKNPGRFENCSEQEIIDSLDKAFRKAVKMEYEKDMEYGLNHISDISGGLDARMSMWAAHELGYDHIQLLTYGKAGYLDEKVSKQIADFWNDELLIIPIDDATFLYDIDDIVFLNGGLSLYSGISGGNRMLRLINLSSYGLEHDGIFGGAVISSWYGKESDSEKHLPTGCFSTKLISRVKATQEKMFAHFGDHELFLWYTRGFQGMANTHQIRRNYTEACAAYMDVEFAQLCMDIPYQLRMHHNIHKKWIIRKYPDAARFKWTGTNAKLTENKYIGKIRKIVTRGPFKILKMLGLHRYVTNLMVPLDYLLARKPEVKKYMDYYVQDSFNNLPIDISEQLLVDMKTLYSTGTGNEKSMVLTVLASLKLYFNNSKRFE